MHAQYIISSAMIIHMINNLVLQILLYSLNRDGSSLISPIQDIDDKFRIIVDYISFSLSNNSPTVIAPSICCLSKTMK